MMPLHAADPAYLSFEKMTPEDLEDVRKRALAGSGVQTGPGLEYWKKQA